MQKLAEPACVSEKRNYFLHMKSFLGWWIVEFSGNSGSNDISCAAKTMSGNT